MPFLFKDVCTLFHTLETLETEAKKDKTISKHLEVRKEVLKAISQWFDAHQTTIDSLENPGALLSTFFPEKRADRVTQQAPAKMGRYIVETLGCGRRGDGLLERHKDKFVFSEMVGRVMAAAENPLPSPGNEVTVEEVDDALTYLGTKSPVSKPNLEEEVVGVWESKENVFRKLFTRFSSLEGKWFVRLVMKDMFPIVIPVRDFLFKFHFLLPTLYNLRCCFFECYEALKNPILKHLPRRVPYHEMKKYLQAAAPLLTPKIGLKIQRPDFLKARSLGNAGKLVGRNKVAMERKYDGEYCQIHVEVIPGGKSKITVFSKSGRDSTYDRLSLHGAIITALGIDSPSNRCFQSKIILEGEMLVYSEAEKDFMEFSEIRKHVTRGCMMLGTWNDTKPDYRTEHLCLVLYDIMLRDDRNLLTAPYHERREMLEDLITTKDGYVFLAEKQDVDLSVDPEGPRMLEAAFAKGIAERYEGFVLKPWDAPCLGVGGENTNGWIKLKKDYIPGLGDCMDVAILGMSRIRQRAEGRRNLMYEHVNTFYIGYLTNKEDMNRKCAPPSFRIVDTVSHGLTQKQKDSLLHICKARTVCLDKMKDHSYQNPWGKITIDVQKPPMQHFIWPPLVFEVVGGSFHKPSNQNYHVLRWPRITRVHEDRDWIACPDFGQLQEMAVKTLSIPEEEVSQEQREWAARLQLSEKKGMKRHGEDEVGSPEGKRFRSDGIVVVGRDDGDNIAQESLSETLQTEQRTEEDSPRSLFVKETPAMSQSRELEIKEVEMEVVPPLLEVTPEDEVVPMDTDPKDDPPVSIPSSSPPTHPAHPSPLTNATIFLAPSVASQPNIRDLVLTTHLASSISPTITNIDSLTSSPRKLILLVDPRMETEAKEAISAMQMVPGLQVWNWRVVRHSDAKGERRLDRVGGRVDWDLFFIFEVRRRE